MVLARAVPAGIGLARGGLFLLAWWAGKRLPPGRTPAAGDEGDWLAGRWSQGSTRLAGAVAILALAATCPAADPAPEPPILAVLPYDGPPDPGAAPNRVVMLLVDFDRLSRLARPDDQTSRPAVSLTSARHALAREADGRVTVESTYELWVEGDGEATWALPVGPARDLEATVDGRSTPLAIASDGSEATVPLAGGGRHAIRFRRWLPVAPIGADGELIRVPVNRAAFARVSVARGDRGQWVDVPEATGSLSVLDAGIEGALGPTGTLEVRWFPGVRPATPDLAGTIEAAVVWDIRPAGNLVRLRLAHGEPDGVASLRLAHDPGTLIREETIPNLVAVRREGTPARPEWVAHFDPPWAQGVPIEVVAWRAAQRDAVERHLPRLAPTGVARVSGSILLRRPGAWSGRLEAGEGLEAWAEGSAVKGWGPLPGDDLAPSGAGRFEGRIPRVTVASAPIPSRRSARTRVQVTPRPGRLDATIDTVLVDIQGFRPDAAAQLPPGFRVVRVDAGGASAWRPDGPDRIRIRFDGPEAAERSVRIVGFTPAPPDRPLADTRAYQAPIPWPKWDDAVEEVGTLTVAGAGRTPAVVAGVAIAPALADVIAGRASYRVEKPAELAPIRWAFPLGPGRRGDR